MLSQISANGLNNPPEDRESCYIINCNDITTTASSINNESMTNRSNQRNIDNTVVRNRIQLQQDQNATISTNLYNVHDNQYPKHYINHIHDHSKENFNPNVITTAQNSVIDPVLLQHIELALNKHFSSKIIEKQQMLYDVKEIDKMITSKVFSNEFTNVLLSQIKGSPFISLLMGIMHSKDIQSNVSDKQNHLKMFNLSMKNKASYPKNFKGDNEFKALNKPKSEFFSILRKMIDESGFFRNTPSNTPSNIFHDYRRDCIILIAKVLHNHIFNKLNSAYEIQLLTVEGKLTNTVSY
jgi:hypothetical protein